MTDKPTNASAGAPEIESVGEPLPPYANGEVVDRRSGLDNRQIRTQRSGKPGEPGTGLERRRGPGRRLSDFTKAAEEGEMTSEQFLFLVAIDEFKRANGKSFPNWTDVLEVIRLLGYRKTMPSELKINRAEDWTEKPDTPAGVRPDGWENRPGSGFGSDGVKSEAELADEALEEFEQSMEKPGKRGKHAA